MKRRKGMIVFAVAALLALCMATSGCIALLNSVLDNLDTVFSLLDPTMSEGNLPEGTVYGSENDLAVGFNDGDLYAFWDDRGEDRYEITVKRGSSTTTYDEETDAEYFDGASFDLQGAGYSYSDDLTVELTRATAKTDGSGDYALVTDSYVYDGLTAAEYRKYTKNVPGGFTTIDYYVACRYELFELFAYMVIFRPDATTGRDRSGSYYEVDKDIKMGYDYLGLYAGEEDVDATGAYEAEIKCAVASFEDSAAYSYSYSIDKNNVGNIYLKFSYSTTPKYTTDTNQSYKNDTSRTETAHYKNSASTRNCLEENEVITTKATNFDTHVYPIDCIDKVVTVSSSDQLYFAIKKGYQPKPIVGSNAYYLYREMRRILATINKESYSDVKKVHMIYDYIVNTVIYDYDFTDNVIEKTTGSDLFLYKCLYMEGVFGLTNNKTFDSTQCVAICDGLSKAFLCMARIEGLNAIKISGVAMTSYGQERGAHAWNKIEINGKWYMVDTTWGNQLSSSSSSGHSWFFPFYSGETNASSGKKSEYLSHDYCLVADDGKHEEDPWYAYPEASSGKALLV